LQANLRSAGTQREKPHLAVRPSLADLVCALQRELAVLLLTRLLLPAMLTALTRILGLLSRLLLSALATLLATLIRVVLLLLALVTFVRHLRLLVDPCPDTTTPP
jgi:hypothetical protein